MTISDITLKRALEHALITADQADALIALERDTSAAPAASDPEPTDDEALRFVTGFADIFVTIGILLFIGALAHILDRAAGPSLSFSGAASAAWLLAEFFTRRRRMALPSIVLLVVFVAGAFEALLYSLAVLMPPGVNALADDIEFLPTTNGLALVLAGLGTMGFAAAHYYRFRVPITIAAGMAAFCVAALGIVVILVPNLSLTIFNTLVFGCGILTFSLAMRFDLSDPHRVTRRADIAFWLHLLAAPLIVHTLLRSVLSGLDVGLGPRGAIAALGVFLGLAAVAVAIDRRAILVSGLLYAGIAFGALIKTLGFENATLVVPVVLLTLGAFILLLSAGWHPLRRVLLARLPAALASRLPHPLVASAS